uniref:Uncharacterized protein n=1 Tax=Chromera velia CCMP2878 TaxID=1169474 RepID=A0A0G4F026_9ALVE|eukprot:Cvel_14522.t1-p1 / transcript=Cvel_14522.t1 / gene=Cvel_14522 / organism=Chromera_velia_CCMP2878 / gene_product=hypothetical protein / transcript_product=hypothetical protein / location=Cvel_scaffold1037:18583-21281(+) / protein_length=805 / sequence_SO=supercontig / SO=protein_coding / is_pseudo=false
MLCATGVLGLRLFWKISNLSKDLLKLRDDTTVSGLGSVLLCLPSVFERRHLQALVLDCIERDDANSLQQLFALEGVEGSVPGLIRHAQGKPQCLNLLLSRAKGGFGFLSPPSDLSSDVLCSLTREALSGLIDNHVIKPTSWMQITAEENRMQFPDSPDDALPKMWNVFWTPLLSVLLEARNFECAELLLERGARVDVCDWEVENNPRWPVKQAPSGDPNDDGDWGDEFYRWEDGMSFPARSPLLVLVWALEILQPGSSQRAEGLALLRKLASEAKERGCLDWTASLPGTVFCGWFGSHAPRKRDYQVSALSLACAFLLPDAVEVLLSAGASRFGFPKGVAVECDSLFRMATLPGEYREASHDAEYKARRLQVIEKLADAGGQAALEAECSVELIGRSKEEADEGKVCTLLYFACWNGDGGLVEFLLRRGVSLQNGARVRKESEKKSEEKRYSPLLIAIVEGNLPVATVLLEGGADPSQAGEVPVRNPREWGGCSSLSPLVAALLLCMRRPPPHGIGSFSLIGPFQPIWTETEAKAFIRLLFDKGAVCVDGEQTDVVGEGGTTGVFPAATVSLSPLLLSCKLQDDELVALCIQRGGADPNSKKGRTDDPEGAPGHTPLLPLEYTLLQLWDVKFNAHGSLPVPGGPQETGWSTVETLIRLGAQPELLMVGFQEASSRMRPWLCVTIRSPVCRGPTLVRIISCLPFHVLETKDFWGLGWTPLASAVDEFPELFEVVEALIRRGVDVNASLQCAQNPSLSLLQHAVRGGKWRSAAALAAAGANTETVREESREGCPPEILPVLWPNLQA